MDYVVAHNGVDLKQWRTDVAPMDLGLADDALVVLWTGTFHTLHGADWVAGMAPWFAGMDPRIRLVFVGDGDRRQKAEQAAEGAAVFTGMVPACDVPRYVQSADVCIAPFHSSWPNGASIKFWEYLAMSKPVIVPYPGEMADYVATLGCGEVYLADNEAAFKSAVMTMAHETPESRRQMGAWGRAYVEEHGTWNAHVRKALHGFLPEGDTT